MKLSKHYMFDVTEEATPYVTLYSRGTLGIWQMDTETGIEFRVEMTILQAENVARELGRILTANKDESEGCPICSSWRDQGLSYCADCGRKLILGDTNEE